MDALIQKTNLDRWNELTPIHARSAFYDVESFKAGKSTLRPIEVEELPDVCGKSLLHLQCHFGLDTLSWARRGARVTGVDFSSDAIALARSLSMELGINAAFICSDVYDLPAALSSTFDIVFTSYGAICWLPDLKRWAEVIAHFLKPGGIFYMVEIHPFANVFDDRPGVADLKVAYSYFDAGPIKEQPVGTYADRTVPVRNSLCYVWQHQLGEILNQLIGVGLAIEFVHEFPFGVCATMPFMQECADGWWRLKDEESKIPLLFSLKASNQGSGTRDQESGPSNRA
jgi:SAM-dependent methyltransferase